MKRDKDEWKTKTGEKKKRVHQQSTQSTLAQCGVLSMMMMISIVMLMLALKLAENWETVLDPIKSLARHCLVDTFQFLLKAVLNGKLVVVQCLKKLFFVLVGILVQLV